jgi:hypothetical protein
MLIYLHVLMPIELHSMGLFLKVVSIMLQPHFEASVRMRLTLPNVGTWSPLGLPRLQSSMAEVKTPRLEVFFISLERA